MTLCLKENLAYSTSQRMIGKQFKVVLCLTSPLQHLVVTGELHQYLLCPPQVSVGFLSTPVHILLPYIPCDPCHGHSFGIMQHAVCNDTLYPMYNILPVFGLHRQRSR